MVDRGSFSNMMNDLTFIDERVRSHAPLDDMTPLPEGWKPNNWSVICGRGRDIFDHVGNRRFRVLVDLHIPRYSKAKTKFEKSLIVAEVLDSVREASRDGGFVKQNILTKRWFGFTSGRSPLANPITRCRPSGLSARKAAVNCAPPTGS